MISLGGDLAEVGSRKEIELTSPTAINFGVFRRIKPC